MQRSRQRRTDTETWQNISYNGEVARSMLRRALYYTRSLNYYRSEKGTLDQVRFLVKYGNLTSLQLETVLTGAACQGYLDVVQFLVQKGVDFRPEVMSGISALGWAASRGHIDIVRFLLDQGARVCDYTPDALYHAALGKHLEIVQLFLRRGEGDIEYAFQQATATSLEVTKCLYHAGADIHAHNGQALYLATCLGTVDVVRFLVGLGADIHAQDDIMFRHAAIMGRYELTLFLIRNGADIHARHDHAFHGAVHQRHLNIIQLLFKFTRGDPPFFNMDLALCVAAERGFLDIVKCLVEAGADMDNAIYSAAEKGHFHIVKYMVQMCVIESARIARALNVAAETGHVDVVHYLLDNGADPYTQKNRAFIEAADKGHLEVVKMLTLKAAVRPNASLINCMLDAATQNHHMEVAQFLQTICNNKAFA